MKTLLILLRGDGLDLQAYADVKSHLESRCGGCHMLFSEPEGTIVGLLVNTVLSRRMLLAEIEPLFRFGTGGFITMLVLAPGFSGLGNNVGVSHLRRHLAASAASSE